MISIKQTLLLVFSITSFIVFYVGLLNYLTAENEATLLILIFSSIASVGVMISTFYISSKITKSIIQLDSLMRYLAKNGKRSNEKPIKTGIKEMEELNQNFERMAKTVENTIEVEKKLVRTLQEVDRQKNEFVSMVSHELKTPLVPISGYAQMLKNSNLLGQLTPEQLEAVDEIYSSSKRLQQLIDDIMVAQKLEMGKLMFKKEDIDIQELIADQIKDFELLALEKKIQIINSNNLEMSLTSDKNRLKQVLANLMKNAMDYVPVENGRIEIGTTNDENGIIFYVKDNGIGISDEGQKMIFKKFFQIDTSARRKRGGSGLGLAICRGIIERLGGKIWVESKINQGSTFFFTVPKSSRITVSNK